MNLKLKEKKHIIRFFGLKPIKLKSYITDSEKLFILEQIQESYEERLKEKENIVPLIAGLEADIDILICTLSVQDIDFTNLKYSDLNNPSLALTIFTFPRIVFISPLWHKNLFG